MDERKSKIIQTSAPNSCFFKVIKCVCCTVIPLWKKNSLKKTLKDLKFHEINAHDDCVRLKTTVYSSHRKGLYTVN